MTCDRCGQEYSTSIQNERKKKHRWTCNPCVARLWMGSSEFRTAAKRTYSTEKRSQTFAGSKNPFFGKRHDERALAKMRGRIWSDETRQAFSRKRSEMLASGVGHSKKGTYVSSKSGELSRYDSGYERRRMEFLDSCDDVRRWTRNHGIVIDLPNGRRYVPDLLVDVNGQIFVEEVKGWIRDPVEFEMKNEAARAFCLDKDWKFRVVFREGLETLCP